MTHGLSQKLVTQSERAPSCSTSPVSKSTKQLQTEHELGKSRPGYTENSLSGSITFRGDCAVLPRRASRSNTQVHSGAAAAQTLCPPEVDLNCISNTVSES